MKCKFKLYRGSFNNQYSIKAEGVSTSYTSPTGMRITTSSSYKTVSENESNFKGYFFYKDSNGNSIRDYYIDVVISPYPDYTTRSISTLYYWK